MALAFENVDTLGFYLSGAGSDGGTQNLPALCLGGFRASREVANLGNLISSAFPNIRFDRTIGTATGGFGALRAVTVDSVAYTPPNGVEGPAVGILDGEQRLIESLNADLAVRITRTSTEELNSQPALDVEKVFNNVPGGVNVDNTERAAGVDQYLAIMLRAHGIKPILGITVFIGTLGSTETSDAGQLPAAGPGTITTTGDLSDWPTKGWVHIKDNLGATREIAYYGTRTATTLSIDLAAYRGRLGTSAAAGAASDSILPVPGVRVGLEVPAGPGDIQTIADINTAPGGIVWTTATDASASTATHSTLPVGDNLGVWIHKEIPADAVVAVSMENKIEFQYFGAV